jgi:hypothetical protein
MRDLLESLDNIVERDFNFDDPSQNANAGGRLQTKSLPPVKPVAAKPAAPKPGILDKIGAGISSLFKSNPKSAPATPKPAAPAKDFDFDNMPKVQTKALPPVNPVAAVQKVQQTDRLKRGAAPTIRPERGTVPGQGAGTRTVSVGGRQVKGADADRAINVAQAGAADARLRMGAAQAGLSVKDYAAQQNRLNKAAGDRMMKTAKASDAGVF